MRRFSLIAAALAALCLVEGPAAARLPAFGVALQAQADSDEVGIRALLQRLERAIQQSDSVAYRELLAASADRVRANEFATNEFRPGATQVVIQERDRQNLRGTLPGNGYSLTVDAFMTYGDKGKISTWQLDIRRSDDQWRIVDQELLSNIDSLYRLSVTATKQFEAKNFIVQAEDLDLTLVEGSVFVVETDRGVTGLVMLGRGEMLFRPTPETERSQVRIFSSDDTVQSRFDAAYLRFGTFEQHADPSTLIERPVDPRQLRRAEQLFREESTKSFTVDLADLTRETWSLMPAASDFLAEVRTRRFDTLTYTRSMSEAEDISFFERARQRNIAAYASKEKLAERGRFYHEDDLAAYDVLNYEIQVTSLPERHWIDGTATMRLRVRAPSLGQLTIRLADSLVVRSIYSREYGRLLGLRASGQNSLLINLPALLLENAEMSLTIVYSGRLDPQPSDRETLAPQRDFGSPSMEDPAAPRPEPTFLYSNRSYWYPQSPISDYATATMQISVPATFGCVASGEASSDSPRLVAARDPQQSRNVYLFVAERPVRYLAFMVGRFVRADRWTVVFDPAAPQPSLNPERDPKAARYARLDLVVESSSRFVSRGKELAERSAEIIQFYESVVGDSPYSTFTLAVVESLLPGGHSPGFFAALNQPLAFSGITWRNDPAAFSNYPEFFLAHEIAHQWWGQAVGWRNYHEQWLSEGFSQYFAALYAQKFRGDAVYGAVMRQMRKWAIEQSDQGPVYLGYRIGHIRNDGRAFRAVVYNKGAAVLHMLRQLIGDEVFFRGIRRFYNSSRFTKVGSDDLRRALEAESGRSLDRFFEQWVYGENLPRLTFSHRVEPSVDGDNAVLRIEQLGEAFDLPVMITLQYRDRKEDVMVPVSERITEVRVPLRGVLRSAEVSRDDGPVAEVVRN